MKKTGKTKKRADLSGDQVANNTQVLPKDRSAAPLHRACDIVSAGKQEKVDASRSLRIKSADERREVKPTRQLPKDYLWILAMKIKNAALAMIRKQGVMKSGLGSKLLPLENNLICIKHTMVLTGLAGVPALFFIEIHYAGVKVFSVWWDPFQMEKFLPGEWMNEFIPGSFNENLKPFTLTQRRGESVKLQRDPDLMGAYLKKRPSKFVQSFPEVRGESFVKQPVDIKTESPSVRKKQNRTRRITETKSRKSEPPPPAPPGDREDRMQ